MQLDRSDLVVVPGGGGFIGGHLVAELRRRGFERVRAVDIKPLQRWYQVFDDVENLQLDLRDRPAPASANPERHPPSPLPGPAGPFDHHTRSGRPGVRQAGAVGAASMRGRTGQRELLPEQGEEAG